MSTQNVSFNSGTTTINKIVVPEQNNQAIENSNSVFVSNEESNDKTVEMVSNAKKTSVGEVLNALNLTIDDISEIFESIKTENTNVNIENIELEPDTVEQIMTEYKKTIK